MKATLLLADGREFKGKVKGKVKNALGEVVFCTSMVGYQEIVTTPAYKGQIVLLTFPLIGNYGVNKEDVSRNGTYLDGIIARDICDFPNNFRCEGTFNDYLESNDIVALYDIDTRALTKHLRDNGTMNGKIIVGEYGSFDIKKELEEIRKYEIKDVVSEVSSKEVNEINIDSSSKTVAVYDFGVTDSIIESLKRRNLNIKIVPYNYTSSQIEDLGVDGVILSDGPGNPNDLKDTLCEVKKLFDKKIPMFGIELGHQIMALALGAKTGKLKYGHRGSSQPVKDLDTGRTHITTQNHGYVVEECVESEMIVSHININDDTVEGIIYKNYPAFSVQFHPESSEVNKDTSYLYDNFVKLMGGYENA